MRYITEAQRQILLGLARYKFLTPSQFMKLGIVAHLPYLRKILADMVQRDKPLIHRIEFGFVPAEGRLESVYYLSKFGKRQLVEGLELDEQDIKMPVGSVMPTYNDYKHRKHTIDIGIYLYQFAEKEELEVEFFDTYFDTTGNNRTDKNLQHKNKIHLDALNFIIPDGIFVLKSDSRRRLFLLEVYNGKGTKRVLTQMQKHAYAIGQGSPSQKYTFDKGHRVLSVFEFDSIKTATIARMQQANLFAELKNHFLFKSLETLTPEDFHRNWQNMNGEQVNL